MADLKLSILLQAVDQATGPLRALNRQLDELNRPVRNLSGELGRFSNLSGLSNLKTALGGVGREVSSLLFKLGALGGVGAFAFKNVFIDTAAEMENLEVSLLSIEGSADKAQKTMAWLVEFAKNTPLELATTAKSYMLLKNAGIDPMNGSLMALVDTNAKLNGSQENMIEITRQLGQSWMKNKLQMEEINVLTERGVKVIPLLAKAMGTTEEALMAMISKGKVGRKELRLLFQALRDDARGASEAQAKTWSGMLSTLTDSWKQAVTRIMDAGPFDWLKLRLKALIDYLNVLASPEGLAQLTEIGMRIKAGFDWAEAGARSLFAQVTRLSELVGGFGNLAKLALLGLALIITGPLLMALSTLAAALAPIGAILIGAMLTPVGLIITAVVAAAAYIVLHWTQIAATMRSLWAGVVEYLKGLWQGFLVTVRDTVDAVVAVGSAIKGVIGGAIDWVIGKWQAFTGFLSGIGSTLGNLGRMSLGAPSGGMAPAAAPLSMGQRGGAANVGGKVQIEVNGPARVKSVQSSNPRVPLSVDSGLMFAAPG